MKKPPQHLTDRHMARLERVARRVAAARWTSAEKMEKDLAFWHLLSFGYPMSYVRLIDRVRAAEGEAAWKRLAVANHPDRGGSDAAMARINTAREAALAEALQFYADRSNWKRGSDEDWSQADTDGGQIARAALAEAEGRAL